MIIPEDLDTAQWLALSAWSHRLVERGVIPKKWKTNWVRLEWEKFRLYWEAPEHERMRNKRKDVVRSFQQWLLNAEKYRQEQELSKRWHEARYAKQGDAARRTDPEHIAEVIPLRREQ